MIFMSAFRQDTIKMPYYYAICWYAHAKDMILLFSPLLFAFSPFIIRAFSIWYYYYYFCWAPPLHVRFSSLCLSILWAVYYDAFLSCHDIWAYMIYILCRIFDTRHKRHALFRSSLPSWFPLFMMLYRLFMRYYFHFLSRDEI